MPQDAIRKIVGGHALTREEAQLALTAVMDGEATPAQIGALLVALRMKGETVDEVTGFVLAMRSRLVPVRARTRPLLRAWSRTRATLKRLRPNSCAISLLEAPSM